MRRDWKLNRTINKNNPKEKSKVSSWNSELMMWTNVKISNKLSLWNRNQIKLNLYYYFLRKNIFIFFQIANSLLVFSVKKVYIKKHSFFLNYMVYTKLLIRFCHVLNDITTWLFGISQIQGSNLLREKKKTDLIFQFKRRENGNNIMSQKIPNDIWMTISLFN